MAFSIYDLKIVTVYFLTMAAAFGLVMGSFLNCVAWRIVRGEDFLKGRSHCPVCGHILSPIELIPVVSYIIQKGRCRSCHSPIALRYPLSELIFSALTVLTLMRFDLTLVCARNFVFLCCLFCLTLTDLDDQMIPDGCHIVAALAWGIAAALDYPGWQEICLHFFSALAAGGGILVISLVMDRVMGRETMGGGDIKLIAVSALYLGPFGTLFMLILSCLLGLLGAQLLRNGFGRRKEACGDIAADETGDGKAFPFGPALAAATYVMLLYGDGLIKWYMSLF